MNNVRETQMNTTTEVVQQGFRLSKLFWIGFFNILAKHRALYHGLDPIVFKFFIVFKYDRV